MTHYIYGSELRRDIRAAVRDNNRHGVEPKALLWTDYPDADEDLFGPGTKEELRPPNAVWRRGPGQRLHARLGEGGIGRNALDLGVLGDDLDHQVLAL